MEQNDNLLYEDILGLIEFRGIKQGKIAEVMKMSYNNWYKTKLRHLSNLSINEIDALATFLDLPTEQVFSLCHNVYKRAIIDLPTETP
jgi:hypothetical protein